MAEKLASMWPEIALFVTTCVVMITGLSPSAEVRRVITPWIAGVGLAIAAVLAAMTTPVSDTVFPHLAMYGKTLVAGIGLLLLPLMSGVVDREYESLIARGLKFDALRSNTAEFYSFFLFSMTGLMLCAGADDLIWLFLALELVSLPTYVMVAISTGKRESLEAGVKYFFLGALGAAIFLYGFTLLYGATGHTDLAGITSILQMQAATGGISDLAMAGLVLSLVGISFKIAAVPMHFYTPDVYQGAAAPIAAMLAFVPKAAGFFAILLLVGCVGWQFGEGGTSLPEPIRVTLWVVAVLTMTAGNVLALLQNSVKRMLAYSSIAHSGYMLVGVIAGPGDNSFGSSGVSAVLFYLLCYGVMNTGVFAVVSCVERHRKDGTIDEIDGIDELRGLWKSEPALAFIMVACSLSLLGLPPLLGFFGKLPLFTAGIGAGEIPLVIILGFNSAIAAYYYLRLAGVPFFDDADAIGKIERTPFIGRQATGLLAGVGVILLTFFGAPDFTLVAERAGVYEPGAALVTIEHEPVSIKAPLKR